MSLSWRKQLYVALCPDGVGIVASGGLRGRVGAPVALRVTAGQGVGLAAPLAVFRRWLEEASGLGTASLHLTLSDEFARYALVPAAKQIGGAEEFRALAQACLDAAHGKEAQHFELACEPWSREQATFACALRKEDIVAIRALCQDRHLRLHSLQPAFIRAINRWHRQAPGPAILVMPGSRSVTGAVWTGRTWGSVWQQPLAVAATAEDLSALFRRESLLRGVPTGTEMIVFNDMQAGVLNATALEARLLAPEAARGELAAYPLPMAALALPA